MPTLAVYPGSFDPLTNGHVDIISRGARLFDRIVVAILVNAEKAPLFTMEERVDIARAVFRDHANVEVDTFDGLLVDYVARRQAQGDPTRAAKYEEYLRANISYALGEDEQKGLLEFYRRAHAIGLIPAPPELRFHGQA